MSFGGSARTWITGLSLPQEYICLESPEKHLKLRIMLQMGDTMLEVTSTNLLLGYKPMLIGLLFPTAKMGRIQMNKEMKLFFHSDFDKQDTEIIVTPNPVAELVLRPVSQHSCGDTTIILLEGIHGSHRFIHPFYQWVNRIREFKQKRKPGNIGLIGNLYEQVRTAYAVPRKISIYVVSDGEKLNMFPTDLHGPLGEHGYVGSLRIGGRATEQVERLKNVVLAEVDSGWYQEAYALGVNHMKELSAPDLFPVGKERSNRLQFPLPTGTIGYRELTQRDSTDAGIHRIHFYDALGSEIIDPSRAPLTHVHQYYLQWLLNNGVSPKLLLR